MSSSAQNKKRRRREIQLISKTIFESFVMYFRSSFTNYSREIIESRETERSSGVSIDLFSRKYGWLLFRKLMQIDHARHERPRWMSGMSKEPSTISRTLDFPALNPLAAIFGFSMAQWPAMRTRRREMRALPRPRDRSEVAPRHRNALIISLRGRLVNTGEVRGVNFASESPKWRSNRSKSSTRERNRLGLGLN